METTLKTLEAGIDTAHLDKAGIDTYVQASRTRDNLTRNIVDPFARGLKGIDPGTLYERDGVKVDVREVERNVPLSNKEFVDGYISMLTMIATNNENGQRMTGVKRFDDTIAVDAIYLSDLVDNWSAMSKGTTTYRTLHVTGEGKDALVNMFAGTYLVRDDIADVDFANISLTDIGRYLAAEAQVKALDGVTDTFEEDIKAKAPKDEVHATVFRESYGNIALQVVTIPNHTPDYSAIAQDIRDDIAEFANLEPEEADGQETFVNSKKNGDAIYISIDALLTRVAIGKQSAQVSYHQTLSVLYEPEAATVLVR